MATEQAFYALVSVKRQLEGKSSVFSADGFADISGIDAETAILKLNAAGIINGMGKKRFAPEKSVTRAEFATMAVKSLGIFEDAESGFADVRKTDWFYPYVSLAYKYGIVFGVSEQEFNPNGIITCKEAAAMLERAAKRLGVVSGSGVYKLQYKIPDWAVAPYIFCLDVGILTEEKEPDKVLNRAEIAQMIYNMLEKAEAYEFFERK